MLNKASEEKVTERILTNLIRDQHKPISILRTMKKDEIRNLGI
jgi:hypothetical protein